MSYTSVVQLQDRGPRIARHSIFSGLWKLSEKVKSEIRVKHVMLDLSH